MSKIWLVCSYLDALVLLTPMQQNLRFPRAIVSQPGLNEVGNADLESEDLDLSSKLLLVRLVKGGLQEYTQILMCSSENQDNNNCVIWSLCEISCKCGCEMIQI